MRPATELSNTEKATLLHQLLPTEIKGFLSHMEQYALTTIKAGDELKKMWAEKRTNLTPARWLKLAQKAADTIQAKRLELATDAEAFARELFSDYMGVFTIYYLQGYITICGYRFRAGVIFLFDIEPAAKQPFQKDEI